MVAPGFYRAMPGKVGKLWDGVMEIPSYLKPQSPSGGKYFFSEHGVGVNDLVLIGNRSYIGTWLDDNAMRTIVNQMPETGMRSIYCVVSRYRPGKKYRALCPAGDATKTILTTLLCSNPLSGGFGPFLGAKSTTGLSMGLLGGIKDLGDVINFFIKPKMINWEETAGPKLKDESTWWYIRLSYYETQNCFKVGEKHTHIEILQLALQARYGFS